MKVDIKKVVEETATIKNKIETLEDLLSKRKKILLAYMEKTGETCKGNGISCFIQERVKIEYNKEELKNKLDKELYNEIIQKEYSIEDFDEFKKILKDNNISLKKFKGIIRKEEKIDEQKISNLFEEGELTLDDISGCYNVTGKKSVIIKNIKNRKEEIIETD